MFTLAVRYLFGGRRESLDKGHISKRWELTSGFEMDVDVWENGCFSCFVFQVFLMGRIGWEKKMGCVCFL